MTSKYAAQKKHQTDVSGPTLIDWASPKQKWAFEYGPYPLCLSGGFGSAKTYALCLKAIWLSDVFPKNRGVIARKLFEELKHTTMTTFFKICPPSLYQNGGKRSDSEKYLQFNNGSEVLWMHMDDPETENVIRGIEINWFILDQAEEIKEELFDLLLSRLGRWDQAVVPENVYHQHGGDKGWKWRHPEDKRPIVPTYPMIACNPDTELHWIYRRFHPDSPDHKKKIIPVLDHRTGQQKTDKKGDPRRTSYYEQGYRMVQMPSWENKFLPKQNLQILMSKDKSFRRRFVEGEWGIPEGQIHIVEADSILKTDKNMGKGKLVDGNSLLEYFRNFCTLHRTMDHGDSAPTCVLWWAVDKNGNIFCYREYYQPGKLISEHREAIYRLSQISEGVLEPYRTQLADPSIYFKTSQKEGGRWSVHDEYTEVRTQRAETRVWWQKADNNELGTRNRINEYLKVDSEWIHPLTKKRGSPRIFFVMRSENYPNGCDECVRQLNSQRRKKIGTEQGKPIFSDDRDDKNIPDHAYDPIRYFVASRPPLALPETVTAPHNSFSEVAKRYDDFDKRGGYSRLARRIQRASARR